MHIRTLNENLLHPRNLSTMWTYVLLSIAFRDIHEFLREGMIHELATEGTVYGNEVKDSTLLAAGIAYQLPLAMVLLSRVLPQRINRIANLAAVTVTALGIIAIWPKDGDDIVFGSFQLAALAAIAATGHRWATGPTSHAPLESLAR